MSAASRGRWAGVGWARVLLAVVVAGFPAVLLVATAAGQQWDDMSAKERGEARRNYDRFQKLPPETRREVERNYDRWQELPPAEKERLRTNYQQYRNLPPAERRRFRHDHQSGQGRDGP